MTPSSHDLLLLGKILAAFSAAFLLVGVHAALDLITTTRRHRKPLPVTSEKKIHRDLEKQINILDKEISILDRQRTILNTLMATAWMFLGLCGLLYGTAIVVTNGFIAGPSFVPDKPWSFYLKVLGTLVLLPAFEVIVAVFARRRHGELDPHTLFTRHCSGCRIHVGSLCFRHMAAAICGWVAVLWTDDDLVDLLALMAAVTGLMWMCVLVWQVGKAGRDLDNVEQRFDGETAAIDKEVLGGEVLVYEKEGVLEME